MAWHVLASIECSLNKVLLNFILIPWAIIKIWPHYCFSASSTSVKLIWLLQENINLIWIAKHLVSTCGNIFVYFNIFIIAEKDIIFQLRSLFPQGFMWKMFSYFYLYRLVWVIDTIKDFHHTKCVYTHNSFVAWLQIIRKEHNKHSRYLCDLRN